mmetsp:Transcript_36682/g.82185  ORF Transcript_36682/g.82185 Transcript_36682/m.82185 type:complete len:234 (+) Transcript_36682:535-1236(+)
MCFGRFRSPWPRTERAPRLLPQRAPRPQHLRQDAPPQPLPPPLGQGQPPEPHRAAGHSGAAQRAYLPAVHARDAHRVEPEQTRRRRVGRPAGPLRARGLSYPLFRRRGVHNSSHLLHAQRSRDAPYAGTSHGRSAGLGRRSSRPRLHRQQGRARSPVCGEVGSCRDPGAASRVRLVVEDHGARPDLGLRDGHGEVLLAPGLGTPRRRRALHAGHPRPPPRRRLPGHSRAEACG